MALPYIEGGTATPVQVTGFTAVTSANAQILGVGFHGSTSGSVQFFAGTTGSASITPIIRAGFATSAAYLFARVPAVVSGAGFSVNIPASSDPNLVIYWSPVGGP